MPAAQKMRARRGCKGAGTGDNRPDPATQRFPPKTKDQPISNCELKSSNPGNRSSGFKLPGQLESPKEDGPFYPTQLVSSRRDLFVIFSSSRGTVPKSCGLTSRRSSPTELRFWAKKRMFPDKHKC